MICLILVVGRGAHAQGTAFVYQGQLLEGGVAAKGIYDIQFTVLDAPTNGNPVSSAVQLNGLGVTNGLFTAGLDFGSGVFTGASRWLSIAVRSNGNQAFTALMPPQPLTPTPYAIASGAVLGSVGASQISGVIAPAQLPGVLLTNNAASVNLTGTFTGDGTGLTNVTGVLSSNLNVGVVNTGKLVLQQPTLDPADLTSTNFVLVGLSASNTLFPLNVQWTNLNGTWVLALAAPPNLPLPPGSDGVPTGSNGGGIAGVYSIYDASSLAPGQVTNWPDLGPYGHNLSTSGSTAPKALANVLNGRPAVTFSNAPFTWSSTLTNSAYQMPSGPNEIFLMLNHTGAAGVADATENLLTTVDGLGGNNSYGYLYVPAGAPNPLRAAEGNYPQGGSSTFPTNQWMVVDAVFQGAGGGYIYTNNVIYAGPFNLGTAGITNGLALGGYSFNGMVTFLGVYTNILSASDRTSVYQYLTNRYH